MMQSLFKKLTEKSVIYWTLAISFIYIALSAYLAYKGSLVLALVPVGIFIAYIAFFHLDWLMFFVVFSVPLSVQLRFLVPGLPVDLFLPTEPLIIGITILFIMKLLFTGSFDLKVLKHPVSIAIFIYLAWLVVSAAASSMPLVSFKFIANRVWFLVVFYFIATQLFKKASNVQTYIWLYTLPLIIVIFYSIIRLAGAGLENVKFANKECFPFYNDHTSYGAALAMLFPVLIGLFIANTKASNTQRFFHLLVIVIYVAALVFSYTRAAWLTLGVALGCFVLIWLKVKPATIFVSIAAMVGLLFAFQTEIKFFLEDNNQDSASDFKKHLQSAFNVSTDASNVERLNRWNCALRMYNERPVLGWGPGTYQFQYAPFQKYRERTIISTNFGTGGNAHSEYLGTLAEAGIPGLVFFSWILIIIYITGLRVYRRLTDRKLRIITVSLLMGLVTYYLHAFLNDFLDTDKISALFWGFAAVFVALDVYFVPKKDDEPKQM
jgi:O-antigen ligase